MNRQLAAMWVMSGGIAALWALGRLCDLGEAFTRDLIAHLFHDFEENDQ